MSSLNGPGGPANQAIALAGVNVLLIGPAGSGKTFSLGTLADAGLELFYLGLESGMESLMAYWTDKGQKVPDSVHWHIMPAPKASFTEMMKDAKLINSMSLDALAKMNDPDKAKHDQYVKLFQTLADFPDDRTGRRFGSVDSWGTDRVLAIDGMTGLGRAVMANTIGGKAVRSQSDWGISQDQLEKLLRMLCDGCRCHIVVLAHVEREVDQVLGGVKLMVSTLGKALAPKIPPMFSDVILAVRTGDKWTWDTASPMADVKTRNLPIRGDNAPSFAPIVAKWKSRGGVV